MEILLTALVTGFALKNIYSVNAPASKCVFTGSRVFYLPKRLMVSNKAGWHQTDDVIPARHYRNTPVNLVPVNGALLPIYGTDLSRLNSKFIGKTPTVDKLPVHPDHHHYKNLDTSRLRKIGPL